MPPLLAPLTVDDLFHADALGDGKLTDANLLAVAMDKMPAEVEAMPFAEGRPYMDELEGQLADGGAVDEADEGRTMVTGGHLARCCLGHRRRLQGGPCVTLRPMTVGDVYGARART